MKRLSMMFEQRGTMVSALTESDHDWEKSRQEKQIHPVDVYRSLD
jgi:hypothetical protein